MEVVKVFEYNEWLTSEEKVKKFKYIEECERRIKDKKQALSDMQNEYDLLMKQEYTYLVNNFSPVFLFGFLNTKKAYDGFCMLKNNKDQDGNELDNEKEYEEIEALYQFKNLIKDILNIDDLDIKNFLSYSYGIGYYVYFDYKDNGWELYIPTKPSFGEFELHGKRAFQLSLLHCDSKYYTSVFDSTFFVKDLIDIMRRAVEKYCKDERQN